MRAIVYKLMCRFGKHNMMWMPTLRSCIEGQRGIYEVCCARCGEKSLDPIHCLLIEILNRMNEIYADEYISPRKG